MGKFNFGKDDFAIHASKKSAVKDDKFVSSENTKKVGETVKSADVDTVSGTGSSTRGRKGQKMPMMNMRFTDENYDYLKRESAVRGKSVSGFVNWLIETYRSDPKHVNYTNDYKEYEQW